MSGHKDVASLLVEHGADVDGVLDDARRQNNLSGVRRVLGRAQLGSQPPLQEETRDLDALVREIEGPEVERRSFVQAPAAVGRGRRARRFRSLRPLNATTCQSQKGSANCEEDEADDDDQEEEEDEVEVAGDEDCENEEREEEEEEAKTEESGVDVDADLGPAPEDETQALDSNADIVPSVACTQEPTRPSSALDGERWQRAEQTHAATQSCATGGLRQGMGWTLRQLPRNPGLLGLQRSPGTFYTVEVFGVEGDSPGSSIRAGPSNHRDLHDPRNWAVVAARCQGRPGAELALIPFSNAELSEHALLAEGGLAAAVAGTGYSPAASAPASSPPSSPPSLPDRDVIEEYDAWCVEARRRCLRTPGPVGTVA